MDGKVGSGCWIRPSRPRSELGRIAGSVRFHRNLADLGSTRRFGCRVLHISPPTEVDVNLHRGVFAIDWHAQTFPPFLDFFERFWSLARDLQHSLLSREQINYTRRRPFLTPPEPPTKRNFKFQKIVLFLWHRPSFKRVGSPTGSSLSGDCGNPTGPQHTSGESHRWATKGMTFCGICRIQKFWIFGVNFSSGRYFGGKNNEVLSRLPFDAGFEAVGLIAAIGGSVHHLKVGMPVAIMSFGSYAEFVMVPSKHIMPVPRPDPEVVAILTSGLTASIALEVAGKLESGEVVLVTAAAGGTGQFAVQLAKLAGNKVVATCGGEKKAVLLKSLGVDRVIDYKKENIKSVLKKEFPGGLNIIYESVGGEMFDMCLNALATYGRLVVIGMISQYQGEHGWKPLNYTGLCEKILAKSQTVAGFFLPQYAHLWPQHMDRLFDLYSSGKLKVAVDPKEFLGLRSVADAVEYLHSGESHGKVVVCVDPTFIRPSAKL
ncbi:hypothetical protein Taro_017391 [Colocasia esculenta]|uniref:Enoyl reductase (ER) domain-containing protein n=1 Tax=Colocasia esculenta TaxID=4460 RepID=A0A843UT47_COLES|nr:hypothetical protein [Colocasia esculenta]